MSTLTDSRAAGADVKKVQEVSTDISVDEGRGQVELLCEDKEDREESSVKAEQGSMKIKTEELPSVRSPCQSCDPRNILKVAQEADHLQHRDIYQHKENPTNPRLQDIQALQHLNYNQVAPMGLSHHQGQQPQQHQSVMGNINRQMKRHEVQGGCGQYPGQVVVGHQQQQVRPDHGDQALNHLSAQLRSVLDFSRLPTLEEALSPSGSPPLPPSPPPLPLFSRCPATNQAQIWGLQEPPHTPGRIPLNPLPPRDLYGPSLSLRRPWPTNNLPSPPAASSKPSLDGILCTSLVALTNKHREGKYWFKSGCPTPDPRWPAVQQLMAGPIPGDCDYSELRTAFLSHGQTCHLFVQNNQAWLERNQEKFGSRQVKFGYVVFTEAETAERLFRQGGVIVRRASGERIQVRVKRMDGLPAQFYHS